MRRKLLHPADLLLALLCLTVAAHSSAADEQPTPAPAEGVEPAATESLINIVPKAPDGMSDAQRIEAALAQPGNFQLHAASLEDVFRVIADVFQITLEVDWRALAEEGVEAEQRVGLDLRGLSLSAALQRLCKPLGLTYYIDDSTLKVTTQQARETSQRRQTDEHARISRILKEETQLKLLEGTTLSEALDLVSHQFDVNMVVPWGTLAEAGIPRDTQVMLSVDGVPLAVALELLFQPLRLTWYIDQHVLHITTLAVAEQTFKTKVYDVRNLQAAGIDAESLAAMLRQTIRPNTWSQRMQFGRNVDRFRRANDPPPAEVQAGPGPEATMAFLPGLLVITQSQPTHAEIEALLVEIEQLAVARASARQGEDN